jgi:type VI secretion system protein ImpA
LAAFLSPVDPGSPSGAEIRNDPRFHALERLLQPASRSARGQPGGAQTVWQEIMDVATALAGSGRDLRLLVIVARAMYNVEGLAGMVEGFDLLANTLDEYWDDVHPQLRDRSDPREAALGRINALKQLENDDNGLLGDLKLNAMLTPRGIGPILGADLASASLSEFNVLREAASGLGSAERASIAAAHAECVNRVRAATGALAAEEPERLAAMRSDLEAAAKSLAALSGKLSGKLQLENGSGIGFFELERLLSRMQAALDGVASPDPEEPEAVGVSGDAGPSGTTKAETEAPRPTGAPAGINSRRDVERSLDQIIAFYERTEPSSPIPHLARRMRRMVPMDFVELMAEIAPSGMKEFKSVAGMGEEKPGGKRSDS